MVLRSKDCHNEVIITSLLGVINNTVSVLKQNKSYLIYTKTLIDFNAETANSSERGCMLVHPITVVLNVFALVRHKV